MQIMPQTGKRITATLGSLQGCDPALLKDPETNIRIGTSYLSELASTYGHDWIKVLAAYNAGDWALQKWIRRQPRLTPEEFVETISFPETQQYVKKVLFTWHRYKELYQGQTSDQKDSFL